MGYRSCKSWTWKPVFWTTMSHCRFLQRGVTWSERCSRKFILEIVYGWLKQGEHGGWQLGSCLENPRDGGAWWAAIYGVTQSRTRLKRLSSIFFFRRFSILGYYITLSIVPSAIQYRCLLVICFVYCSVYMLIPASWSLPLPTLSCLVTTGLFSVSVTLFLFWK